MELRDHHAVEGTAAINPARRCLATRGGSLDIARPLSDEDQVVQACDDASPTKWHLAHTTWFYETFVLSRHLPSYAVFDEAFAYCFNSYYEAEGPRHPRPKRGLLTRPSLAEVHAYRAHVDSALEELFARGLHARSSAVADLIALGIAHEEQHQELMLTDILALFAESPLHPAYRAEKTSRPRQTPPMQWIEHPGGISEIGADGSAFGFDCERPAHKALLHPYALSNRLVTNGEWLQFMADGGYSEPALWLSDGWSTVRGNGWNAPAYWIDDDGCGWRQMTLAGLLPVEPAAPVVHISYFEADAFARWAHARLPTEQEWEVAAGRQRNAQIEETSRERMLRPRTARPAPTGLEQMFGATWQWTASAFHPYPGFAPAAGAVGEYNGKFMCGQQVVRGSSCVTTPGHSRPSYRSFFYPSQRWQFTGLRLARNLPE